MSGDPALIETIRASVIGDDEAVVGPFGLRRVTYADYTASGRSSTFIEDFIRATVLPLYANTHTESSGTKGCMRHGHRVPPMEGPCSGAPMIRRDLPSASVDIGRQRRRHCCDILH